METEIRTKTRLRKYVPYIIFGLIEIAVLLLSILLPLTNIDQRILVFFTGSLVIVTAFYAWQTQQQADASVEMAKEMREQRLQTSRPMIIQKPVHEVKLKLGANPPLGEAYFHHFVIVNVGNGPAIELEVSLHDENGNQICLDRETFLRAHEEFVPFSKRYTAQDLKDFGPEGKTVAEMKDKMQRMSAQLRLTRKDPWFNKAALEESKQYYLICKYRDILGKSHLTQLQFKVSKAEEMDEKYVVSAKMELKFDITEQERIDYLGSKPQ